VAGGRAYLPSLDELIRRKLLQADARNDPYAIREALHMHFDRTLGTPT
jgi:hypothetical protein